MALSGTPDAMPAPTQLLGLLPPPPVNGWPESFALQRVADELRRTQAEQTAYVYAGVAAGGADDPEPYVRVDARYPLRRRTQRLSYSVWQVIATYWEGLELQPVLEAESTADRLRMALLRLRELTGQIAELDSFF